MLLKYRITKDVLLRTDTSNADLYPFMYYQNQFDVIDSSNSNYYTVWDYNRKLNKVFNSQPLVTIDDTEEKLSEYINCELLLRQNFSWKDTFGILVIIKSYSTNETMYCKLLTIDNWKNSNKFELIDGDFWSESVQFKIPKDTKLTVACELISSNDILFEGVDIGLIIDYPTQQSYEPLVSEKPLPSEISTNVVVNDKTHFITVTPVTSNNSKTVRQTLIDYFGYEGQVVPISIRHIINYGVEDNYKSISVGNHIDNFLPVTLGLDFSDYLGQIITIFVSTEYNIDNKLLIRDQQLLYDFSDVLSPVIANIIDFEEQTIFPVTVTQENIINQNVIQTNTERKIVPIIKNVYIKVEETNFQLVSSNVSFNDVTIPCYMVIINSDQTILHTILSEKTSEGIIYFGLQNISIPNDCTYKIFNLNNDEPTLIKFGSITI